jgi:hypothetical protein
MLVFLTCLRVISVAAACVFFHLNQLEIPNNTIEGMALERKIL